jgi:hypothetical protein
MLWLVKNDVVLRENYVGFRTDGPDGPAKSIVFSFFCSLRNSKANQTNL